jgi:citrate/tricarballylate utilization protein
MVHQSLVVGLALTVVATIAAAILEHGFGAMPPYGWVSVPVIAGGSGGVLLLGSTTALRFLDRRRDPAPGSPVMLVRDAALLDVLGALAVTGLATVLLRSTPAGPVSLAIHLVVVWGAILVAAWSKLAHAQYRFLALIKDRIERVNGEWLNDARRNGEQVEGGDRESASAQRP